LGFALVVWTWVLSFVVVVVFFFLGGHCLLEFTKASLVFILGKKQKNKRAKNSSHHQRRKKYKAKRAKPSGSPTTCHCNWHGRSNNKSKEITKIELNE